MDECADRGESGADLLDRLDDNGARSGIDWMPSAHSKGTTALLPLGDMD
jgi:hypothetical protein